MKNELLSIIRTVAPGIATAFGGPLAGMAARVVSETLLGKPDGSMKNIETALLGASPETMLKLKEADHNFTVEMERLGVDLERIHADDRDSARERQVAMKDNTPAILAVAVFIGFFGILGVLMFSKVPTQSLSSLNVMLGALATIIVQVAAYYFGSSRGSAEKNRTIAGLMGR
jgi:hypothetical protein